MYGYMNYPQSAFHFMQRLPRFPYPKVNTKIFASSIRSTRFLMEQASLLLDRLGDSTFAFHLMSEAQQGKKAQVDNLIKSVGLKVPVITKYTPSGIIFILQAQANQLSPVNCCSLTLSMMWGG